MIHLKNVTARISERFTLTIPDFSLNKGENWLVTGANSSGKTAFGRLLSRQVDFSGDFIISMNRKFETAFSYVSPDLEKKLFLEELRNDDSEFKEGGIDFGRTALEIMMHEGTPASNDKGLLEKGISIFQVGHILHKGFRFLSSGETRKILIIRALLHGPDLLIIDDPFSGLDKASRTALAGSLKELMQSGVQTVLIMPPCESVPDGINRVLVLENGTIAIQGEKNDILNSEPFTRLLKKDKPVPAFLPDPLKKNDQPCPAILLKMIDLSVSYYGQMVFRNLNFTFKRGEHWSVVGPNGAGKSTLLSMISGNNPKAYGKEVWIFEKKRGTGESIWDIKKHLGMVSSEFHRNYRAGGSLLNVVISGFFDSIGVYDVITAEHMKIAEKWLSLAGLKNEAGTPFDQLSFGYQRVALILRAMVKHPILLILDEPFQGIDMITRSLLLNLLDVIAGNGHTHLLHVTHDPSETLRAITHRLIFEKKEDGVYEAAAEVV